MVASINSGHNFINKIKAKKLILYNRAIKFLQTHIQIFVSLMNSMNSFHEKSVHMPKHHLLAVSQNSKWTLHRLVGSSYPVYMNVLTDQVGVF